MYASSDLVSFSSLSQGCSVSLSSVGVVQGMTVRDGRGRPLRLSVTTEVLGGTALRVSIGRLVRVGGWQGGTNDDGVLPNSLSTTLACISTSEMRTPH